MQTLKPDYRGHLIYTHASGPASGPFVAAYSTWLIEPSTGFRAQTQGTVTGIVFGTTDQAMQAARGAAMGSINTLLGPETVDPGS